MRGYTELTLQLDSCLNRHIICAKRCICSSMSHLLDSGEESLQRFESDLSHEIFAAWRKSFHLSIKVRGVWTIQAAVDCQFMSRFLGVPRAFFNQ